MTALHDETELRRALKRACDAAGGWAAFAGRHGLDPQVVMLALEGGGFSGRLARALGYARVVRFVKQEEH